MHRNIQRLRCAAHDVNHLRMGGIGRHQDRKGLRGGQEEVEISTDLAVRSPNMLASPVMLPPGRARLLTKPEPIGSVAGVITIGTVAVARWAAAIAGVATATITSGLRAMSSAASAGRSWKGPCAARFSTTTIPALGVPEFPHLLHEGNEQGSIGRKIPRAGMEHRDAPNSRWLLHLRGREATSPRRPRRAMNSRRLRPDMANPPIGPTLPQRRRQVLTVG